MIDSISISSAHVAPPQQPVSKATQASAASCSRNQEFIGSVLDLYLKEAKNVLEIGSGTGHHACFFGPKFPHLTWQTSDRTEYHDAIHETISQANAPSNVLRPIRIDIETDPIEQDKYDVLFSSNTLHCMSMENAENLIQKAGVSGVQLLIFYGPFNLIEGQFANPFNNGEGNAKFDAKLKAENPSYGIKDMKQIQDLCSKAGFAFVQEHYHTQANNFALVFRRENGPSHQ